MGCCEALPSELILEILSRTSLGSLDRCKEVSKSWKKMIYEPTFLPLHCNNTNCLFGYFHQGIARCGYTATLVGEGAAAINRSWPSSYDMKILASSDQGILCCRRRICKDYLYYACKPTTNQWQELPGPILGYQPDEAVAVIVVDSDPLRYVILRLSSESSGMQYYCEIFDSEIWEWEKIECASPYGDTIHPMYPGVTIGHSVYWLTLNDTVLAFDVDKRCYRRFPLPKAVESCERKHVVEYKGGLGLMCSRVDGERNEMELWVAVEKRRRRKQMQWRRRKMVVDMTRVGDLKPIEFCSSNVVFMSTYDGAAFYNLENRSISSRVEIPFGLFPMQIFRFRSDFKPVRLKGGP